MRKRVVITGMGVVTPIGHTVREMFANILEGVSGTAPITHFDASTFPTTFAAEPLTSTVYTVACRVRGEWSLLCRGRLANSRSMPARSWSSHTMSLRISGL